MWTPKASETKVDDNPGMRTNKTMTLALVCCMVRLYSPLVRDKVRKRREKEESGFCKKTLGKPFISPNTGLATYACGPQMETSE